MKSKVNPELLAECLDGIRSDRRAPDKCLEMHPEATELRPLLETALSIVPMPVDFDPGFRIRGRVALIESIRAEEEAATKSLWRGFWEAATGPWCRPAGASAWRVPVPAIILAVVFMLTASLGGGAAYASQAALPGDTLYQVKTALEGVQAVFAMSDEARAQLNAECAGKRLDEAARAVQMGRSEAAHLAAQIYASCVAQAEQHLAQAAASGRDVNELANLLAESLARQQAMLASIEERVPEPAKSAMARAAQEAEKGLTTAVSIVQRENARAGRRSPDQVPAIANTVPDVKPAPGPDRHQEAKDAPVNKPASTVTVSSTVAVSLTQMISDVSNLARDPVND
ncbi:MAG TPA: DUF5667 domain-containing protein, partial [Dehalococcoidia bacterium]|nr:DUF5667 domain-containing protein [Dehalococcoidia bacterium]